MRVRLLLTGMLVSTLLSACNGDEARVTVGFHEHGDLAISMLRVSMSDSFHNYELRPSDFNSNGETQPYHSPELPTQTKGMLHFSFALVEQSGDTVSSGAVDLPLRRDWKYAIDILADTSDPTRFCFGCQGSRPFRLAPAYREPAFDSLYVVWGGNYISNPVVY